MARTFGVSGKYLGCGTGGPSGGPISVHAWAKLSAVGGGESHLVAKWNITNCFLLYTTTGQKLGWITNDGGGSANAVGGTSLATNTWISCGGVTEGTGASQQKVYVNGSQDGAVTGRFPQSGANALRIGTNATDSGAGTRGDLAEVAIWSVALTAAEMLALAKGVSPLRVRPASLFMYIPIFGVADPEADLSGNARNGTVTGSPVLANHAPVGQQIP